MNRHLTPAELDSLRLAPDVSILQAIESLTRCARKIMLITGADYRLLGIVTDYDIRKAILDHVPLDRPVSEIMNPHPVILGQYASDSDIVGRMRHTNCVQLPLVDGDGRVVDVRFMDDFVHLQVDNPDNMVVIMAGGLGTRLRPMTERIPKPLLTVGGRPLLFILLDQILTEGFERVFISLNYKSDMIIKAVSEVSSYRDRVDFLMEGDTMLGTAGSLSLLPERPAAPFVVINGDLLTNVSLKDMLQFHCSEGNKLTMAVRHEHHKVAYGVVDLDGTRVTGMREKPVFSYYFNTGIYVVDPDVLDTVPSEKMWNMTDMVEDALARDDRVGAFPVHEFWIDIGTPDQYERAQTEYENNFR
ncbi:nucleotidyltransferase family protein [Magnetospirillum aberrantis]|uniref:NTP transferase domain-containing protein n=1 Tax=Magnetospirillum aberrantis SpK TaxID=908842 RepID=A0A7C9QR44_9PROT|nr:nucleotidyltransferase family protein [Magnetospirillum aberrantis]NFV78560.1 NTP transferase domain-containing protein [Magnetospirillum aberrantis SpK]